MIISAYCLVLRVFGERLVWYFVFLFGMCGVWILVIACFGLRCVLLIVVFVCLAFDVLFI